MQFTKLTNKTKTNMYTSKTITRPDGTQCLKFTRVNDQPETFTEDQLRMQRMIEEFGTSA